jgi:recombination protein RecT
MTKAITKTQRTIGQILTSEDFKSQVALVLPSHLTPERFLRVALTATRKNPKLLQCDQGSFFSSLLDLSQVGLEPDGRLAHLIPYGTECKLIIDYKGLVDLAMRTGKFSKIHADKVCEADLFKYSIGEVVAHEIDFRHDRGDAYAYYAQVVYRDGTRQADCMKLNEVQAIQKRSKAGGNGPWITDFHEMGKKTVFRRLSKWVPMSSEFRQALDADADTIEEKRFANAKIANSIPNFEEKDEVSFPPKEEEEPREEPPKAEDYSDALWLEGKK